ncbi:class I SAM-dependent methyltransferase [Rathayibacter soli]|uniref:class I SAM-dependent methyltransferase n=1 Tax=Rathayibacter soli TaxID=3144168 RepID=UPI0027E42F64|nr:methyltransferase domain-containing protein [Glaciibacter superstes]
MAERTDKSRRAASFDSVAGVYEESRPGYPQEAVDWLVPADAARVADVGAGTGKFTRLLERPGRQLVAVDPSPHMLDELRRALPTTDARLGSAEQLPLEDASVDAVTFAQSWHWVDAPAATAEVARALRPGGTLGLIWNLRDERVEWMRELGVAMHADGDQFTDDVGVPQVGAPFAEPEAAQFGWASMLTREGVLDLVRSRSYFALMTDAEQDATLDAVSAVLARHPQTAGRDFIEFPYVTVCFRYRRP